MAALPYMPLYVADYLADAAHLSTVQHGAYLLLIMTYWQRGEPLPDNDKRLARIARMTDREWLDARDDLAEFFDVGRGIWAHGRIERELEKVRSKSDQARNAGRASAERRSNGRSTDGEREGQRAFNHTDTDTDTDVIENPNPFAGESWDGWIAMRVKAKKVPTERAVELAIAKLGKLKDAGHAPNDVLDQSTMNGWTGLFEVKGGNNGHAGRPSSWI